MKWNPHSEYKDKHAPLSASKGSWLSKDDEEVFEFVDNQAAAIRGTKLHALAKQLIDLGVKLPATNQTLNLYVNDCIGHRMKAEQILFVSPWAFGTADAIICERDPIDGHLVLRIFDLKNGRNKANERQLLLYAAFFCLEYGFTPNDFDEIDLRFYQHDRIYYVEIDAFDIFEAMERTKAVSAMMTKRMAEEV